MTQNTDRAVVTDEQVTTARLHNESCEDKDTLYWVSTPRGAFLCSYVAYLEWYDYYEGNVGFAKLVELGGA